MERRDIELVGSTAYAAAGPRPHAASVDWMRGVEENQRSLKRTGQER